jgi:proteasome lid subunit RPN8/RPN11
MYLSRHLITEIEKNCLKCLPLECCGFLLGSLGYNKVLFNIIAVENQSKVTNRYEINPLDFYIVSKKAHAKGQEIIGFYHSHPFGKPYPSSYDKFHAWPGYSYIIIAIDSEKTCTIKSWQLSDSRKYFNEELLISE